MCRQRRLEERLATQQQQCDDALAANAALEERAAAVERESYETTAAYRKELLARAAEVEALRRQVADSEARERAAATAGDARETSLLAAFEAERMLLHERAAALQGELGALREWHEARAAHAAENEMLRAQLAEAEQAHALKVRELHRQLRAQREAEEGGENGSGEGSDNDEGEETAENGLPYQADMARLLQHNRKMGQQMRLFAEVRRRPLRTAPQCAAVSLQSRTVLRASCCPQLTNAHGDAVQETEELQRQMKQLEEERKALARDVKLREEMERQYAKRGSQQVHGD